jgi:D-alanine--poly(phosphoribitol) ligase subunit 1
MAGEYLFNLGRAFLAVAAAHPERPALRYGATDVTTYGTLARLSGQVAAALASKAIGRGSVVAIQNGKTSYGYAAMLGCLIAGAAYTHLDPKNPSERLGRILSTCRPRIILADGDYSPEVATAARLAGVPTMLICDLVEGPLGNAAVASEPNGTDPAYIMFTSARQANPRASQSPMAAY